MTTTEQTISDLVAFGYCRWGLRRDPVGAHIMCGQYPGVLEVFGTEYRALPIPRVVLMARTFDRARVFAVPMGTARVLIRR